MEIRGELLSSCESLDPQVDSTSLVVRRFDSAPLQDALPGGFPRAETLAAKTSFWRPFGAGR